MSLSLYSFFKGCFLKGVSASRIRRPPSSPSAKYESDIVLLRFEFQRSLLVLLCIGKLSHVKNVSNPKIVKYLFDIFWGEGVSGYDYTYLF